MTYRSKTDLLEEQTLVNIARNNETLAQNEMCMFNLNVAVNSVDTTPKPSSVPLESGKDEDTEPMASQKSSAESGNDEDAEPMSSQKTSKSGNYMLNNYSLRFVVPRSKF